MRKTILLTLFVFVLGMTTCFAEIREYKDDFTGGKMIITSFDVISSLHDDMVAFMKYTDGKTAYYELNSVFRPANYSIKYSNSPVGIKIDDYSPVFIQPIEVTSGEASRVLVRIEGNNEIINQIANAKRVALKIERTGSIPLQYVLTDSQLAEWKQVIAK